MLKNISRFYNTIKHLKFQQFFWRFFKYFPKITYWTDNVPKIIECPNDYIFIPKKGITDDYNEFTFLNVSKTLNILGWNNPDNSKLWNYNLHYFNYLLTNNKIEKEILNQYQIIENWIKMNPYKTGIGWEPYPTSLRIINWIKWHWNTNKLSDKAIISLWNQVRWLSHNIEYHLLGNHLFVNAKALLYASVFFNLNKDSKIFTKAISIIKSELDTQFLSDGAHFELSPMYHSLAMEDLLDIINLCSSFSSISSLDKIKKIYLNGISWLRTMVYDNEELSHFNDSVNEIAPKFSEIENFAKKLNILSTYDYTKKLYIHKFSGYVVYKDIYSHIIADFGKIGPDYIPGHSHADTLSFEMSIKSNRVIVNSGINIYAETEERLHQRGTSAHSTVQIDNQNSSDVWSSFRVGKRANTFNHKILNNDNKIFFTASHDGYKDLKNSPIHKRSFNLDNNSWTICDEITGKGNKIVSRFFLHPEISIRYHESGFIISKESLDLAYMIFNNNIDVDIINTVYSDSFGHKVSNKCIVMKFTSPNKIELKIDIIV